MVTTHEDASRSTMGGVTTSSSSNFHFFPPTANPSWKILFQSRGCDGFAEAFGQAAGWYCTLQQRQGKGPHPCPGGVMAPSQELHCTTDRCRQPGNSISVVMHKFGRQPHQHSFQQCASARICPGRPRLNVVGFTLPIVVSPESEHCFDRTFRHQGDTHFKEAFYRARSFVFNRHFQDIGQQRAELHDHLFGPRRYRAGVRQ